MGLLDRLAADLISDSIGVSPRMTRRLVRRAVGNPLLLAGGAALAGAFLSEMVRGQQAGAGSGPSTWAPPGSVPPPPPPPPLPGAQGVVGEPAPTWVPPPPPPPPTAAPSDEPATSAVAGDESDAEPELPAPTLYAVVRTMVAAALADGTLSAAERTRIQEKLGSGELPEEQVAQVRRDLLMPASPAELAALVEGEAERELLYRFAALVTMTDEGVSPTEAAWLGTLAAALGLYPERAKALEAELFS
jgi:tellurite resistance protein